MNRKIYKYFFLPLVILSAGFLWGLINLSAHRHSLRFDVTRAKQHTLTEATQELLKTLRQDIQVTVLLVGLPPKYLQDILKEYEINSDGKITARIIDPLVQLGYAAQFGNVINAQERKVVVEMGEKRKTIDFTNGLLSEEALNNALLRILHRDYNVYFLTGHNEAPLTSENSRGLSQFVKLLSANNIIPKELLLIPQGIPDDCDLLVVAGPQDFLSPEEDTTIKDYLNRGGDALFLVENVIVTTPDKPLTDEEKKKNPSLNEILEEWGVHVHDDVVVDLKSHASGDVGSPATRNYLTHKAIVSGLDYTFYVRPRSMSLMDDRRSTIKAAPLVMTMSKEASWGETNRELQVHFDKDEDEPGPVPLAFVIWEAKEGLKKASDTRLIVFTDADFLTNAYIKYYNNAQMGLNVVGWLTELDYQTFLDPHEIKIEHLDLTSQQKLHILIILLLIPLLIALWGAGVWIGSRR